MSAVERLRGDGFEVRITATGRLGITPKSRLSADQVGWLAEHRDELLTELRAEATNDTDPAARWKHFIGLCEQFGLHAGVVDAEFREQDRADLLLRKHSDERLSRCARTLSEDVRLRALSKALRERTMSAPASVPLPARDRHLIGVDPELIVECDSCRHLTRSPLNPAGGTAGCAVRDDVPRQVPGRRMVCELHTSGAPL